MKQRFVPTDSVVAYFAYSTLQPNYVTLQKPLGEQAPTLVPW